MSRRNSCADEEKEAKKSRKKEIQSKTKTTSRDLFIECRRTMTICTKRTLVYLLKEMHNESMEGQRRYNRCEIRLLTTTCNAKKKKKKEQDLFFSSDHSYLMSLRMHNLIRRLLCFDDYDTASFSRLKKNNYEEVKLN